MKLFDFMLLVKERKRLAFCVGVIAFIAMLLFTIFFNKVDYEINAAVRFEGSILLTTAAPVAGGDTSYNRIDLKLNQLDDKSAMEYVQNNKSFYDDVNMVDYQLVVSNLNSKEFMNSVINSYSFKSYLIDKKIITSLEQISIVEQTDVVSIRLSGESASQVKVAYDAVLAVIPTYIEDVISGKLTTANTAIKASIAADQVQADNFISEYAALKSQTGFGDIITLNKGVEILNKLSSLSHNINVNSSVASKFDRLLANEIAPDVVIKSADFSGLKLTNTLISYVIIELIAAVFIAFLAVFLAAYHKKAKTVK